MKRRGFLQAMLGLLLVPKEWNLLPNPEMGGWKHVLVSWDMAGPPIHWTGSKVVDDICTKALMDKGSILADSKTGLFSIWVKEDGTTLYKHDA